MDAQDDLGLRCPHKPEDTFSHGENQIILAGTVYVEDVLGSHCYQFTFHNRNFNDFGPILDDFIDNV